ncbi:MAG TPA: hypothetical protein VH301_11415 [Usitatibacter sp.]|nr:hypothetical protein [Usitatibacter sp.]
MDRIATLYFVDGSKLAFDFPMQTANEAGRQLRMADLLVSKHIVIEAEGQVFIFPVTSIKYITLSAPEMAKKSRTTLPRHAIVGARVRA